jgi:hypothetical protein
VCEGVAWMARITGMVRLRLFRGGDRERERGVRETGLGVVEFVGGEGDSGFGDIGFRETVGLGKVVSEGEATFDQVESVGDAGTEGV